MKIYAYICLLIILLLGAYFYSVDNQSIENNEISSADTAESIQSDYSPIVENGDEFIKNFLRIAKDGYYLTISDTESSKNTNKVNASIKYTIYKDNQKVEIIFTTNKTGGVDGLIIISDDMVEPFMNTLASVLLATQMSRGDYDNIVEKIRSVKGPITHRCQSIGKTITLEFRKYEEEMEQRKYVVIMYAS